MFSMNLISIKLRQAVLTLLVGGPFTTPLLAQTTNWQESAQTLGSNRTEVLSSTIDKQGNTYLAGWFVGSADFGSTHLVGKGKSNMFIAKLASNGKWEWALTAETKEGSRTRASAVAIDAHSNLYVAGNFGDILSLGNNKLTSQGDWDGFVATINKKGKWGWARAIGGASFDEITSLAVGQQEDVVIAGRFRGIAFAGTHQLQSRGSSDGFVARLSKKGDWQWATASGGAGTDAVTAVALDQEGSLYATGYSNGDTLNIVRTPEKRIDQLFVLKLEPSGKRQWLTEAKGSSTSYGKAIAVNEAHQVIIAGNMSGETTFADLAISSNGGDDALIAQLDNAGHWQWITKLGNSSEDVGVAIAFNELGNICVAGTFQDVISNEDQSLNLESHGGSDAFLIQLTNKGKMVGALAIGGDADDVARGLCIDASGRYYLNGVFSGNLKLGHSQLETTTPQVFATRFLLTPFTIGGVLGH
jgi:hypothetical protein